MNTRFRIILLTLLLTLTLLSLGFEAAASTLNQNVSWTIDRSGTSTKYRVAAYGDSIYAGYNGSTINAAKYSAPTIDAEYISALWNADIESVRRAKSGRGCLRRLHQQNRGREVVHAGQLHPRGHLRDVRQRWPAGALELQEPDRHLRLQRDGPRR